MPRKIRQLKADLREAGFILDPKRGRGSHTFWVHEYHRGIGLTLSGHDGDDAHHYQERRVGEVIARARAQEEQP